MDQFDKLQEFFIKAFEELVKLEQDLELDTSQKLAKYFEYLANEIKEAGINWISER